MVSIALSSHSVTGMTESLKKFRIVGKYGTTFLSLIPALILGLLVINTVCSTTLLFDAKNQWVIIGMSALFILQCSVRLYLGQTMKSWLFKITCGVALFWFVAFIGQVLPVWVGAVVDLFFH